MAILVLNAGSSTLKFAFFESGGLAEVSSGTIETGKTRSHGAAAAEALGSAGGAPIEAVGHRVVHGGTAFRQSVRIGAAVREALGRLSELAPLHNPPALDGIDAVTEALPRVPQVAVFDTTFYADLPPRAHVYPLPYAWHTQWGMRRFGFHGLSHSYCAGRAAELLARRGSDLRLVSCHLGNGCSATAVRGSSAIATTMGFTPMEGLMMGSRAGSVDPGILLWALRHKNLSVEELDDLLNHRSGLLGVSGVSSDYRAVEQAALAGNGRARLALEIYVDRVRAAVGALAALLGGLDSLLFTAGVGEGSAALRAAACEGLGFLGLRLDPEKNLACAPDEDIAAGDSPARILVVHTREELVIARETRRLVLE